MAAFAVVADGVFHQVVDHLLEQGLVALDSNWFRLEMHLHIGIGGQLGQTSHDAFGHGAQVHRLGFVGAGSHLVKTRQNEHVVDQRAHGLGFLINELGEPGHILGGHQTVGHQLGIAGNHLQGRLHFMGDIGRELAAHLLGPGQLLVARESRGRSRRLVSCGYDRRRRCRCRLVVAAAKLVSGTHEALFFNR